MAPGAARGIGATASGAEAAATRLWPIMDGAELKAAAMLRRKRARTTKRNMIFWRIRAAGAEEKAQGAGTRVRYRRVRPSRWQGATAAKRIGRTCVRTEMHKRRPSQEIHELRKLERTSL